MSKLRVIIAGGGTGGHIFPAVAIAHALQRLAPGVELLFVGARGKMEMEKIPQEGFNIVGLDIVGFNRNHMWKNLTLPIKIIKSNLHAKDILRTFNPHVVVGVGGFASFPILHAAQRNGIPTLIQEQNSFAGKSNKILGRKAAAICVAYPGMEQFFPADNIRITGNPVRSQIRNSSVSQSEGLAHFGLDAKMPTVLIAGGSLGAQSINEAINAHLPEIANRKIQLIWQTGKAYYGQAQQSARIFASQIKVFDFIKPIEKAYAACNIVISRAGALAIAELCIAAKPVIFVPYPHAAEDHQTSNAKSLVAQHAAWMIKDADSKADILDRMRALLGDESLQQEMTQNLRSIAIKDADEQIANQIITLAGWK